MLFLTTLRLQIAKTDNNRVFLLNPSVTKGIGTHIGYRGSEGGGGGRADSPVSHDSLDLEA